MFIISDKQENRYYEVDSNTVQFMYVSKYYIALPICINSLCFYASVNK